MQTKKNQPPTGPAAAASAQVWGRQAAAGGVSAAGGFGGFLMARCNYPNCSANAMSDGTGKCYWHNDTIDPDEKQRNRARGGHSTRKIEPWALPESLQPVSNVDDLQTLYNSALKWLTDGTISPAQAGGIRALAQGLKECLELRLYAEMLEQRRALLSQATEMGIVIETEESEELCLPSEI